MMMPPAQVLWQSVVLKALMDATQKNPSERHDIKAKAEAIAWIERGGSDFRLVCHYAGFDPGFIRERYLAGQVDGVSLRRLYVGPRNK